MKKIKLTQGKYALVDDEDYEFLSSMKWQAHREWRTGKRWYAMRTHRKEGKRKTQMMHRLITHAPNGVSVDHINSDGLDNRKCNLRFCTQRENCANRGPNKDSKSGYKGVYHRPDSRLKNKWVAQMSAGGKRTVLGYYKTAIDAARAYDRAAKATQGEFAWTNFGKKGGTK
jgi:hypothetical protein